MDENPYRSPRPEDRPLPTGGGQKGPLRMAVTGFFAGGFMGAGAGTAAAVCLWCLVFLVLMLPGAGEQASLEGAEVLISGGVIAGTLGAMCGGVAGALLGPLLGVIAGLTGETFRQRFTLLAIVLAAACGGLLGAVVGSTLPHIPPLQRSVWLLAVALVGGIAGGSGGAWLGNALAAVNWGRPARQARSAKPG